MKRFLLYLLLLSTAGSAFAQYNGSGYYRVQNKVTQRYIRVIDNKGSVNLTTTDADLGALETKKYFENVVSDPASIIYITPAGSGYNFESQGTTSYSIIGYYVKLYKNSDGTYKAYAENNGMVKYLCDENTTYPEGVVLTNSTKTRDWYIKPVNQANEQYFAFKPTITVGNEYYTTIYASFPFTVPAGMTAYYISIVDDGKAVWKEVKDGKVPASTAVFVKCKSANYADNKITIGENGVKSLSGNLMKGVYFNNGTKKHNNQLAYDPNTMRILGVMSNGKLGFITTSIKYIPANTAYLVVPANSPSEISLVSESEYKPEVAVKSITLSETSMTMHTGDSHTLTATVLPADATDKTLEWSSSNNSAVTVDKGVIKAIGYGKSTITATSISNSTVKATCEVNVYEQCTGVQLSTTNIQIYEGESFTLTANTLPLATTDGLIEWSVNDERIIKRNNDGTIIALSEGTAEVIAKSVNGGHIAKCKVTVKAKIAVESITLSKQSLKMYVGEEHTLTATVLPNEAYNKSLSWNSSNNSAATVDKGVIKAIGYGESTITATSISNSTVKATCKVNVYEQCTGVQLSTTNIQIYEGESFTLTANTLPLATTDGLIEWSINDERIIKRNNDGTIIALSEGTAEVIAKSVNGGHIAKCKVTVKAMIAVESITLSKQSLKMYVGEEYTLTATVLPTDAIYKDINWTTSNNEVATIDNEGNINAVGHGKTTITVTSVSNSSIKATCDITVYEHCTGVQLSATNVEITVGNRFTLTASTLPLATTDGQIEWSVNDERIIKRNDDGTIIALSEGTAEVIAKSVDGGHIAKCTVKVKTIPVAEKVILSEESLLMYTDDTHTLTAEVLPENVEDKKLTWLSSSKDVVTVSDGRVTAIGYGKANIIAFVTTNDAAADTCQVMVYEHTTGVKLSATNVELTVGKSFTLTANTLPLSTTDGQIEWNVSDERIIERSDDGTIIALSEGEAEVIATSVDGGHVAKCIVTVKAKPNAEKVILSDDSLIMYAGDTYTMTAEVIPEDAADNSLTWLSTSESVLKVKDGNITAIAYGEANIIAFITTNKAVADTCSVMVYEHTTGVEISATAIEMSIGDEVMITANTLPLATSDGLIEWSIIDENIIKRNDDGNIIAISEGTTEIIATSVDGGHIAKCTVKVIESTGIDDITDDNNGMFKIYNMHGVQQDRLGKGVNIVIFENGTSKKVVVK